MLLTSLQTDFYGNRVIQKDRLAEVASPQDAKEVSYGSLVPLQKDGRWESLAFDGQVDAFVQQSVGQGFTSAEQLKSVLRSASSLLKSHNESSPTDLFADGVSWSASRSKESGLTFSTESSTGSLTKVVIQPDQQVLLQLESPVEAKDSRLRYSMLTSLNESGAVECRQESVEILDSMESLVRDSSMPIQNYSSLEAKEFSQALRSGLQSAGFEGDRVVFRRMGIERFTSLMKTGSDRDAASHLFDLQPCDSTAATRAQHGIENHQVTYAHELDLSKDPIVFSNPPFPGVLDELISPLRSTKGPWVMVAWDADKVERAPDAQVEYWLPKDAREAVALVMLPDGLLSTDQQEQ